MAPGKSQYLHSKKKSKKSGSKSKKASNQKTKKISKKSNTADFSWYLETTYETEEKDFFDEEVVEEVVEEVAIEVVKIAADQNVEESLKIQNRKKILTAEEILYAHTDQVVETYYYHIQVRECINVWNKFGLISLTEDELSALRN